MGLSVSSNQRTRARLANLAGGGGGGGGGPTWLATDDFNRADSSSLGSLWTEQEGDWSIVSNRLRCATTDGHLQCTTDLGTVDHVAEMTWTSGGRPWGILCRTPDTWAETYYMGRWFTTTGAWEIYRRNAGTFTLLASFTESKSAPITTRFEALTEGSDVRLNLYEVTGGSATLKVTYLDNSGSKITAGTKAGLRCTLATSDGDDFNAGTP